MAEIITAEHKLGSQKDYHLIKKNGSLGFTALQVKMPIKLCFNFF